MFTSPGTGMASSMPWLGTTSSQKLRGNRYGLEVSQPKITLPYELLSNLLHGVPTQAEILVSQFLIAATW
jgi:hypothetical protein